MTDRSRDETRDEQPQRREKMQLSDLLKDVQPGTSADRDWLKEPPVGKEVI